MPNYAFFNGDYLPFDELKVGIHTNTLHYGMGLFEGIRCYPTDRGPAVFRLHEHVERLCHGLKAMDLDLDYGADEISATIVELLRRNELDTAYIRPLVFLGDESLKVNPAGLSVNLSITTVDFSRYQSNEIKEKGLRLKVSSYRRQSPESNLPRVKSNGGYVNSMLAIKESMRCGFEDALMLDSRGMVAEASGANVFMVRDGVIYTPDVYCILPGITRATVVELAKSLGYPVREGRFTRDELYMADEAFLTGTAYEVLGVRQIDHVELSGGKPGPVTQEIKELYMDQVHDKRLHDPKWLTYVNRSS